MNSLVTPSSSKTFNGPHIPSQSLIGLTQDSREGGKSAFVSQVFVEVVSPCPVLTLHENLPACSYFDELSFDLTSDELTLFAVTDTQCSLHQAQS